MESNLKVEHIPPSRWYGRSKYKLLEPLKIMSYTIPTEFISDGVTNLRVLWFLIPPMGKYSKAAFLHDYLLSIGTPPNIAHKEMLIALYYLKVNPAIANIMYLSVKVYWFMKKIIGVSK